MMARQIRLHNGWPEVPPKQADIVLLVCRSILFYPLEHSYKSYGDLDADAADQLNTTGMFHVYIYRFEDDLSVYQVLHRSFPAHD